MKRRAWGYLDPPSNTSAGWGGGTGLAALALYWEYGDNSYIKGTQLLKDCLAAFANNVFTSEGGNVESSLYWDFGGNCYSVASWALYNTTGDDTYINHKNYLAQAKYIETMVGGWSGGSLMTFNDTQPCMFGISICADIGSRTNNPLLLWFADKAALMGPSSRSYTTSLVNAILLRSATIPSPTWPGMPTISVLSQQGWGVMRSDNGYPAKMVTGVKGCMGYVTHHNECDAGSFTLDARGDMLMIDPGYYQADAYCHSVPRIDGVEVEGGTYDNAPIDKVANIADIPANTWWESGVYRQMYVDSTNAYASGTVQRVRRNMVMCGDSALVVLDDILPGSGKPGAIVSRFQFSNDPVTGTDKISAVSVNNNCRLKAQWFGPTVSISKTGPLNFNVGSPGQQAGSWVYGQLQGQGEIDWYRNDISYTADVNNPLVSVFMVNGKTGTMSSATYIRNGSTITVTLPGNMSVQFKQNDGLWSVVKP
jgi:hypothetical protein